MRWFGRLIVWSVLVWGLGLGNAWGQQEEALPFELPSIPSVYREPADRAKYLLEHFWDNFDLAGATTSQMTDDFERAFATYVDLTRHVEPAVAAKAVQDLMRAVENNRPFFNYLDGLFEKYLYDAYSPMRDEALYEAVLAYLVESPVLGEVDKIRPSQLLALVRRNQVGQQAERFDFIDTTGTRQTLSDVKADRLLLFFYDPDCEDCQRAREDVKVSPIIGRQMEEGRLRVLAIYPFGDRSLWESYAKNLPADWVNGLDEAQRVLGEELYDLKRMPTLYLLDAEKRVLLKDASVHEIEAFLLKEN